MTDAAAGNNIAASTATLAAGTGIGTAANWLDTSVDTLNATTNTGGIYILEADGVTLNNVKAGAGDVDISNSTGDLLVNKVESTGNAVNLVSMAGSILDTNGTGAYDITAGADSSLTAHNIIGTATDPLEVNINGSLTTVAHGVQNNVSVNVNGLMVPDHNLVFGNVPPGLVILDNHMLGGGNIDAVYGAFTAEMARVGFMINEYDTWMTGVITDDALRAPLADQDKKSAPKAQAFNQAPVGGDLLSMLDI